MRTKLVQGKIPAWSRIAILLASAVILCATEIAPLRTPGFSDYPFDQWASAPERSGIRWEVHLLPPQLSVHQRLIERIQTVVPGGELAKRRGRGELVLLTRFEDSDGRQWRAGSRLNLVNVQAAVKSDELTFTTAAFVRPGDYKVLVALIDSHTMEHSFTRRTLHVTAIKGDPLPESWDGLPSVELLPAVDGPDAWFLPAVKGLLHLPARPEITADAWPDAGGAAIVAVADRNITEKVLFDEKGSLFDEKGAPRTIRASLGAQPPHIDLLVNTTPSQWSSSPSGTLRRNMSVVIPALKVLSAINAKIRPPSAAVIDLTHHRISLETANAAALDWSALDKVLAATNPSVIDAKSLSTQSSMREYFAREVVQRARDAGPERWLIVLSGPVVFTRQDETPPAQLAPDPRRHIIYLRFSSVFANGPVVGAPVPAPDIQIAPVRRVHGPTPGLGTTLPGGIGRGRGRGEPTGIYPDDLERVLKPMGAQVISVTTPEVFRKSVASLIAAISAAD